MTRVKKLCQIALISATLTACKFALSYVANVEIVTLILVATTLGLGFTIGFSSSIIFCLIEMLIYGVGPWVVAYFIHFPLVTVLVGLVSKTKRKHIYAIILAVIATIGFGVLSTIMEVLMFSSTQDFGEKFVFRYIAGIPFFVTHVVSNAIILSFGVYPLTKLFERFRIRKPINEKADQE